MPRRPTRASSSAARIPCIANELLSSIDLSTLIPDLSGFLTSAATKTFTKLLDTAKQKVCDIVNQQINNVISQINGKLYEFQSSITGDLSSLLQGSFSPIRAPSISNFGTQTLAQPSTGTTPVFTPVVLPQPPVATTTPSIATTFAPDASREPEPDWSDRDRAGDRGRRWRGPLVERRHRLGQDALRTVTGMRFAPILPAFGLVIATPAVAQTCLQVDPIERAGEMVSSPYGVDRTGRSSAGFHQGLDLVNTARRSGAVVSALPGTVVGKLAARGGVNLVEVVTGNMKLQYMHMEHIASEAAENPRVAAGQKLGMMGSAGAGNAVHLHLGTLLSGSALHASTGAGRVWLQQLGSKHAAPLTADAIKSAAPRPGTTSTPNRS